MKTTDIYEQVTTRMVVRYGTYTKEDEQQPQGEDAETRRDLKAHTMFHASQIEGIEFQALPFATLILRNCIVPILASLF